MSQGYNKVESLLNNRMSKKIAHKTYLLKNKNEDKIALRYHQTDVVTFYPNRMVLNSGGWLTPTTKERLNRGLDMVRIGDYYREQITQNNRLWYYKGQVFKDGLEVTYDGTILTHNADKGEYMIILNKLINKYVKELRGAIDTGELDLDMGGDCWMCKGLGNGKGHLISHLKEKYLMPTLMYNALKENGYTNPAVFLLDGTKINIDIIQRWKSLILRSVRSYFYKKLVESPNNINLNEELAEEIIAYREKR